MLIKYNVEKLREILTDLSVLTGITIDFSDTNGNYICSDIKCDNFCTALQKDGNIHKRCSSSDRVLLDKCKSSGKYEWHICHAGLYDSAMPIVKSGICVGFIIMGRIRSSASPSSFEGSDGLSELYLRLPFFDSRQLEALRTLLSNIFFAGAIEIEYNELIEKITHYIENNVNKALSVESICSALFISKNCLYKSIREYYGCTVNEYITDLRLEAAKARLCETNETVYAVCESSGFDNCTYFSKLFKRKTGLTPTEYRRQKNGK